MNISTNQWRTIFGIAAAVVAYLLVQEDVAIEGWAKVTLGAVSVALAVISPEKLSGD